MSGATQQGAFPTTLLIWIGVFVGIVVIATVLLLLIRRWALGSSDKIDPTTVMESLERMRASGELSEEEYQAARSSIIGGVSDQPHRRPRPPAAPGERRAEPGYDLTGEPLPGPHDGQDGGGEWA